MRQTFASKVVFLLILAAAPAFASDTLTEDEPFYCEVLAVDGTVYRHGSEVYGKPLQEGDLLRIGDEIETAEGATADLAFDKDWSNVTRVEEKTRVQIKSVFPTRLYIDQGALYAKLKSLPKDSVFQVETPTAIAAVRGTEYRTEYADGETTVSNDSEADTSKVFVYEPDDAGELRGEPTVLPRTQFTGIRAGGRPAPPRAMPPAMQQHCQKARAVLDHKIRENVARGRTGKIQDLKKMEAFGQKMNEHRAVREEKEKQRRQVQRENKRSRDEYRPAGAGNPPGGSGGDGPAVRGDSGKRMDWVADGRPDRAGGEAGFENAGEKPANKYRDRDPGPQQDSQPPHDQFPGKDIRPAPIRGQSMRAFEDGYEKGGASGEYRHEKSQAFRESGGEPFKRQNEAGARMDQQKTFRQNVQGAQNSPRQVQGRQPSGQRKASPGGGARRPNK